MRIYIIILICSLSFSEYLGGYPGAGFRYSTNAREMSLGNSITSEYNQGFNSFSNPALLSKIKEYEFGASYFLMSLDRYVQVLSLSRNLSSSAGTSISIFRSGVGQIEGKDFSNQSTGFFDSSESCVMLSFGSNLTKSLSFGFNLKAIFNEISAFNASGVSTDIGLLYRLSDQLVLSAMINDIYGEYSWEDSNQRESLPMVAGAGLKYSLNDNINLFSKLDYMKPEERNLYRLRMGVELNKPSYAIRAGLIQKSEKYDFKIDSAESILDDFKILLGFGTNINDFLKLDLCVDLGDEEGISPLFSLSFIR